MLEIIRQCFFITKPPLTEQNLPDQTGKVHIVTGGYGGCGEQVSRILYSKNATVYVAGRNHEKAMKAIESIKQQFPESNGRLEFLKIDLADQATIKPAVEEFTSKEQRLDVLTNNGGVSLTDAQRRDPYGRDLHYSTNCLGAFLLSELLLPLLRKTAKALPPASVRVTWASSITATLAAPPSGIQFEEDGTPVSTS